MLRLPLLICALLVTVLAHANGFSGYQQHIAPNRLLLVFEKGITEQQRNAVLEQSGMVSAYTHLPNPAVTLCKVADWQKATAYFEKQPGVFYCSFFITDGQHYAGVLPRFFVKLANPAFEPFLKEKLKGLPQLTCTPDKYIPGLYKLEPTTRSSQPTIELCSLFAAENWCSYAAPDYLLNPLVCSNDPVYIRQWNLENTGTAPQGNGTPDADMDVDSAWTITTGSSTIKVAIVDSGVDTLHSDLKANILPGHDAIGDSTDGYPTPVYPNDGHGTCCAGIVAAVKDNNLGIAGVAPLCKIVPVRAFFYAEFSGGDPLPFSTASMFADAIGWSWSDAGADVLSNSWGLPDNLINILPGGVLPVQDAINQCYTNGRGGKGAALFFSSGNENGSAGPIWPAKLQQTIAVNATSMCDERKNPTDCSGEDWGGDHGTGLDFSAPGVKISSTDMRGNKGYSNGEYTFTFNGTSAACPNAAGVAALVLSLRPDLSAEHVRNVLARTAEKVGGYNYSSNLYNGTWCPELGHGRLNAYQALLYAANYTGLNTVGNTTNVRVFPNPAGNTVWLDAYTNPNTQWALFSTAGEMVMQGTTGAGLTAIDVSNLHTGLYLIKVSTPSGTFTGKITLNR